MNGNGKADIIGLDSYGQIWYTTSLGSNWSNVPGNLYQITAGDINGDGAVDLIGISNNGFIWATTDMSNWMNIRGNISFLSQ